MRLSVHALRFVKTAAVPAPDRTEAEVQEALREITNAESRELAASLIEKLATSLERNYSKAAQCVRDDSDRMLAYYAFPDEHWRHLRTTNIIESNFDPVRSRTNVCKRLRSGSSATSSCTLCSCDALIAGARFNGYQRLAEVHKQITVGPVAIKKAA